MEESRIDATDYLITTERQQAILDIMSNRGEQIRDILSDSDEITEDGGILVPPEIKTQILTGRLCTLTMQDGTAINFAEGGLVQTENEMISEDRIPALLEPGEVVSPEEVSITCNFNIVNALDQEDLERLLTEEASIRFGAYIDDVIINGTMESPYSSIEAVKEPPEHLNCRCSILTRKLLEPIRLIRED